MYDTLKIIHFFCLYAAGGAGLGSAVVVASAVRQGRRPGPAEAPLLRVFGKIGAVAIVVIWLSGLAMTFMAWGGGAGLGWPFHVKLAGAALVLLAVGVMTFLSASARRAGRAPDPARMKPLSMVALAGTVIAVIFAVITFA